MVIGLVLVRLNENNKTEKSFNKYSNLELLLYSLGLGPVFTVLILYFLLMLTPGHSDLFYLLLVSMVYLLLLLWGRKSVSLLLAEIKSYSKSSFSRERYRTFFSLKKIEHATYILLLVILLTGFLILYLNNTLQTPLEAHDILVYGNIGKIYYQEKAVTYSKNIYNKKNGFFFSGSPRPSFSLLLTWEMILNGCFRPKERSEKPQDMSFDIYFRSTSAYYGLLILFLFFFWLHRKNKYLALLGVLVLLSGLRFFLMLVNYHMDSYRIFFLLLSWIFLAYSIKNRDHFSLFLLGVFSGFTAFTHLIGVAVAIINCFALFIFLEKPLKERVIKTAVLSLLVLVFGGIHYLLDVLYGAKWGFLTYF
jgi:hypothetical protein